MAALADLEVQVARIAAATADVAADIRALKDQIGIGLTDAQVVELQGQLETAAAGLEAVAAQQ